MLKFIINDLSYISIKHRIESILDNNQYSFLGIQYIYPFNSIFLPPLLLSMNSIITNGETNVRDTNLYTIGS